MKSLLDCMKNMILIKKSFEYTIGNIAYIEIKQIIQKEVKLWT